MRSPWLLLLAAAGCSPAPLGAPRVPEPPIAPVAPSPEPPGPPPARVAGPNRCLPQGLPKPRPEAKIYGPDTCVDHKKAEASIARKLAKTYEKSVNESTVDVAFACDPLTGELEELVIESGYGHGGNLELWRIKARADEGGYDVLVLGEAGYYRVSSSADDLVQVGRGHFSKAALDKALVVARPALTAIVRELEPPPPPNGLWGRSFSSSSGNFHHYFRLRDGSHELVRHFTGYPGSGEQVRYLGLQLAMESLGPLLETVKLGPDRPSAEERDFFVQSFLAAVPRFDDDFAWWVRDRYVRLARELGTDEVVPALVDVLESGLEEGERAQDEARKNELYERRLAEPIATLVKITGWDPRATEGAPPRPPAVVAREMLRECRRALDAA